MRSFTGPSISSINFTLPQLPPLVSPMSNTPRRHFGPASAQQLHQLFHGILPLLQQLHLPTSQDGPGPMVSTTQFNDPSITQSNGHQSITQPKNHPNPSSPSASDEICGKTSLDPWHLHVCCPTAGATNSPTRPRHWAAATNASAAWLHWAMPPGVPGGSTARGPRRLGWRRASTGCAAPAAMASRWWLMIGDVDGW